jgi:hypothetical protein
VHRLTPEEFEATLNACALTIAGRERAQDSICAMKETVLVTRAAIEQSRDLMAWANGLVKGRVYDRAI